AEDTSHRREKDKEFKRFRTKTSGECKHTLDLGIKNSIVGCRLFVSHQAILNYSSAVNNTVEAAMKPINLIYKVSRCDRIGNIQLMVLNLCPSMLHCLKCGAHFALSKKPAVNRLDEGRGWSFTPLSAFFR